MSTLLINKRFITGIAFIAIVAVMCLAPASALAETVGVILPHGAYDYERIQQVLKASLESESLTSNIKFLLQRPYPDPIAYSNAARKLIAADVDIIVVYGASPTFAVLREKPNIPVLYAGVYEPVAAEIKGKKVVGVCTKLNMSSLVRYLRGSTTIKNMGVVYYSLESDSKQQLAELQEIGSKYGFNVSPIDLKYRANLTELLDKSNADAFIITSSIMAVDYLPTILNVATANKIPTASMITREDSAALITLTADPVDQGKRLAQMVTQLSNGKSVGQIDEYCARKVELVYNVKEATRMGLKISVDLVTEATKLINK